MRVEHRVVLVALVQRVIGAFHEDFGPLDERSGEKTGKGADEDFLEECRLHACFDSNVGASRQTLCGRCRSTPFWLIGTGFADSARTMADPAEPKVDEAENLARLLELELAQKRATWKQAGERAKSIRVAGFVFIFVLIMACLAGAFFVFMRVNEQRANPPPTSAVDH